MKAKLSLEPIAVRVLGSLLEQQLLELDNYPCSLATLTDACNASQGRIPVMNLSQTEVISVTDQLAIKQLVFVSANSETDAPVYSHRLPEHLQIDPAQTAILVKLMLGGPQTAAELYNTAQRFYPFRDIAHILKTLDAMNQRPHPLIRTLSTPAGSDNLRYIHRFYDVSRYPAPETQSPFDDVSEIQSRLEELESMVIKIAGTHPEDSY